MLATAERARRLEVQAARGIASHARERKADLQRALNETLAGLEKLSALNPNKDAMCDLVGFLIDEASRIDAQCMRDIDNAGDTAEPIDLTEANQLWAKVRG